MTTQFNWGKLRQELQRLTDVDTLKSEVQRIGTEISRFDFQAVLSPSAQARVKQFEKQYADLMRTIHQAQRQLDREVNRILRQIKVHRKDVNKAVQQQKVKLEKASKNLQKKFNAKAGKRTRKTVAKKTPIRARKKSV